MAHTKPRPVAIPIAATPLHVEGSFRNRRPFESTTIASAARAVTGMERRVIRNCAWRRSACQKFTHVARRASHQARARFERRGARGRRLTRMLLPPSGSWPRTAGDTPRRRPYPSAASSAWDLRPTRGEQESACMQAPAMRASIQTFDDAGSLPGPASCSCHAQRATRRRHSGRSRRGRHIAQPGRQGPSGNARVATLRASCRNARTTLVRVPRYAAPRR